MQKTLRELCGIIEVFFTFIEVVFIKVYACIKMHQNVLKLVAFLACKLYLNKINLKIKMS